ncbi:Crp/Fnr family transcriptional regulator [Pseudalkalibacillus sp. A8]|uniref:Crp/Fnr family transcriptional regulator n=1 Tax=Pseudalkalibacillus sp. A8 TaxID=3382641 RepID=UPI0038B4D397
MPVLFDDISNWGDFVSYGERLFFKEKSTVYKQGEMGDGVYYIEKGLIKATTVNTRGEELLVNISLPQQLIGVQAMDNVVHFSTTEAIKDSVLYFFPCATVKEIIHTQPIAHRLFLKTVTRQMGCLIDTIHLNKLPSENQLAKLLLNIYDEFRQYEIHLSQKDLTKCTGLTRVTVYKVIKKWKEKGYIETSSKSIFIKNHKALKKYTEHHI